MLLCAVALAAPTKKELSKARAKFQQATELEQAKNFTSALELFREVGELRMTPQVRYHIAHCEEELGRLLAALGGYELAASDAHKVDKSFEKEVLARAEELRSRIPKLVIERGEGAEAARIELDGVALGASSVGTEMKVDPGPHEVSARASGFTPFSVTVELVERDTKNVKVTLTPTDSAEPVPTPDAEPRDTGVKEDKPSKAFPLILGGIGIVSLGASGAFFLMERSALDDLDGQCDANQSCPPSSKDTYDKAKRYDSDLEGDPRCRSGLDWRRGDAAPHAKIQKEVGSASFSARAGGAQRPRGSERHRYVLKLAQNPGSCFQDGGFVGFAGLVALGFAGLVAAG